MIRLSRSTLRCDADTAVGAHLHARIAAAPGQLPGAPLPSEVAALLAATAPLAHPVRERASLRWRFRVRHGAAVEKAAQN